MIPSNYPKQKDLVKAAIYKNVVNSKTLKKGEELDGIGDNQTLITLAGKHKVNVLELAHEFEMGMKVESEHTSDFQKRYEITMDHLTEDPKYYSKLKTIEKGELKKGLSTKNGERWITVNGKHIMIDGEGNIKAGNIGQFNSEHEGKALKQLNSIAGSNYSKSTDIKEGTKHHNLFKHLTSSSKEGVDIENKNFSAISKEKYLGDD